MTAKFKKVFGSQKPIIAMVHFGAMPGSPLHDVKTGLNGIIEGARKDLLALQTAGVDAVMFGNENDRPYEFKVDTASTATMAFAIGVLRSEIKVPFGVNVLWDPTSSMALAAATGASFVREIMTGTYASDMGPWTPDAGAALRRTQARPQAWRSIRQGSAARRELWPRGLGGPATAYRRHVRGALVRRIARDLHPAPPGKGRH